MEILAAEKLEFNSDIKYPDIYIKENSVTFIKGASGCGKTSLLKLFNGMLSADYGQILYKGESIENIDTINLRRQVLLVSQDVFLFEGNIEENYKIFYDYRDMKKPSKDKIKELLYICCADFPLTKSCETMSGGEKQRVFISICLSMMPNVIMLDEPTSALDKKTSEQMMRNIISFCKQNQITLVVVSHDVELVNKFATDIIMLGDVWQNGNNN